MMSLLKPCWQTYTCLALLFLTTAVAQAESPRNSSGKRLAMVLPLPAKAQPVILLNPTETLPQPESSLNIEPTKLRSGNPAPPPVYLSDDLQDMLDDCLVVAKRVAQTYCWPATLIIGRISEMLEPLSGLPAITPFESPKWSDRDWEQTFNTADLNKTSRDKEKRFKLAVGR
ncbi:MAG: hypothetical protein K2W82_18875 [Candidatus Obscuribacterales bacterium]|nr:hypothetical protein [Candidatus Obscuribacterales bacterium]